MAKELKIIVERWIYKAEIDIKTVQTLLDSKQLLPESICFHAQQAVEKYLKAFLVSKDIDPPRTHNIGILLNECGKVNSGFLAFDDAAALTEYAVEARYPDEYFPPTQQEAVESSNIAHKLRDFTLPLLQ